MNLKFFSIPALLLVLFPLVSGAAPVSLNELGYSDFVLNTPRQSQCFEATFFGNVPDSRELPSLSLHLSAFGAPTHDAGWQVLLNDENIYFLTAKAAPLTGSAENSFTGWLRLDLNRPMVLEQNKLTLCLKTSDSTPRLGVLSDSFF
ncbi:MAG: hypothetical protein HY917_05325, partial [Candidatus Diapherotrites archaeon]|nr:hypothetical protein [Candidatus Diapherotrites archaeon]